MKNYLGSKKFYVENKNTKLVYVVEEYETFYECAYVVIHLELVAGWDYVNPDYNDAQGWCFADRFVENVQSEMVAQYFMEEGMKEALKENGYTVLEEISPTLQAIIDKHNEA